MPKSRYSRYQDPGTGIWFMFAHDRIDPDVLHIWARHQTTPHEAVAVLLQGSTTWNSERLRFETETESHVLFWARHVPSGDVLVISCFRKPEV